MAKIIQVLIILCLGYVVLGQTQQAVLEDPSNSTCQGVLMHYTVEPVRAIPPFLGVGDAKQPYRFEALLTLTNMGFNEVKNWQAYIGFQNNEWLVEAPNTVLSDGRALPAVVGNGTTLSGFPAATLKNAIETAGDTNQTSVRIQLVGTEFGVAPPGLPLPANISLPVPGYTCGTVQKLESGNTLQLCCNENKTAVNLTDVEQFLPLEKGDVTITYSVIQTFETNYWAEVVISNDNPLGRFDGWNLTWDWKQGEFIYQMQGAQTLDQDQIECLNGPAGQYYKDTDFSTVASCKASPTMTDLPLDKAADDRVGRIPFCCRNGLLLPKVMDPSQSKSVFRLFVFKVPPNLGRDSLSPPANLKIDDRHTCGQPRLVAPIERPDPSSPSRLLSSVKSWQVTCNLTENTGKLKQVAQADSATAPKPTCCVSFSGFYNSSAISCPTCACGCPSNPSPVCNPDSEPLLIPSYSLLTPFTNRTGVTTEWARLNRMPVPRTLPCGDNCGVNINWHVASDFTDGWSARITVLNWGEGIPDWFAAVELDKAMLGFKEVFTLNGTKDIPGMDKNNTLYVQGKTNFSDFLLAKAGVNPGKQQAVITFDKRKTRGINVTGGDGYPTRVIFNGVECALPDMIPRSAAGRNILSMFFVTFLVSFAIFFL